MTETKRTEQASESNAASVKDKVSGDIILEGMLGIADVALLHQTWLEILDASVDITLDTENLSRIDAAGAQLLYGFVKEAKSQSIALTWTSVSDVLLETATTLGLCEGLGLKAPHA